MKGHVTKKAHKAKKKASGGAVKSDKINVMEGVGSPEEREAMSKDGGFKKGGRAKGKETGKADGKKEAMNLGKKPRGRYAAGGRALSEASQTQSPSTSVPGEGHEDLESKEGD